jgi:hypothetical protein
MELLDSGFPQLVEIFRWVRKHHAGMPPVIDARDVLEDPRRTLGALCDAIGVDFTDLMLTWPPGLRETDGVWAKHWYHEVANSTGFQPYRPKSDPVPDSLRTMLAACDELYDELYQNRIR